MTRYRLFLTASLAMAVLPAIRSAASAQAPPDTDIWIVELADDGRVVLTGTARRATDRAGYDNQPHFLPGENHLLYTSIDGAGQADIYRFDLEANIISRVTHTHPESEYSATLMPVGDRFSAIRVEADSTQRLWSFDLQGQDPRVVLPDLAPVGYHIWFDDTHLALFVLGSPATLHLARAATGSDSAQSGSRIVAENIGRSLHTIPGTRRVSFVQWLEPGIGWVTELDPDSGQARRLAPLLEGNEFYAWTPGGMLVMGKDSKLFRWAPDHSTEWEELADLGGQGIEGISRIAVNPEGTLMAVVGAR